MGRVGGRVIFKYWSCATFIKVGCLIYSWASGTGFAKAGIEKKDGRDWVCGITILLTVSLTSESMYAV